MAGERNPFERQTRNLTDLSTEFIPRGVSRAYVPPGLLEGDPKVLERVQTGAGRRTGRFLPFPFMAQVAPQLIVVEQPGRFYFFAVNNSAANRLFVGFDYEPNANNGVTLEINFGFYEPWVVPTNSIYIAAGGANTPGVIIVGVDS